MVIRRDQMDGSPNVPHAVRQLVVGGSHVEDLNACQMLAIVVTRHVIPSPWCQRRRSFYISLSCCPCMVSSIWSACSVKESQVAVLGVALEVRAQIPPTACQSKTTSTE